MLPSRVSTTSPAIEQQLAARHNSARGPRFGLGAARLKHYLPGDFTLSTREDVEAFIAEARFHVRR